MHIQSILENEPDNAALARRIRTEPDARFPALSAKIKITWKCNLRCGLCGLWRRPDTQSGPANELSREMVCGILQDLKTRGLRKIHFSGGEVFLHKDFFEIVDFARALDLQVNLTTNGTLVDKEAARLLTDKRVHAVNVSIDSGKEKKHDEMRGVPGSFKRAWKGIEALLERRGKKGRGPVVAVNTIVTRKNIETLGDLHSMLKEYGIDRWRLLPVDSLDKKQRPRSSQWKELQSTWEQWKPLLERIPMDTSSPRSNDFAGKGKYAGAFYGDSFCYAPWFNIFVVADGLAYPCCMGKCDIMPYGSVHKSTIGELLDGPRRREICCSMSSGHVYPICSCCDDFLEENAAFRRLE